MTMKHVTALTPGTVVHIATPNGVINIHVGLTDDTGRAVDSISITPSKYDGENTVILVGDRPIRTHREHRPWQRLQRPPMLSARLLSRAPAGFIPALRAQLLRRCARSEWRHGLGARQHLRALAVLGRFEALTK